MTDTNRSQFRWGTAAGFVVGSWLVWSTDRMIRGITPVWQYAACFLIIAAVLAYMLWPSTDG